MARSVGALRTGDFVVGCILVGEDVAFAGTP
jgi:hypothetical protein